MRAHHLARSLRLAQSSTHSIDGYIHDSYVHWYSSRSTAKDEVPTEHSMDCSWTRRTSSGFLVDTSLVADWTLALLDVALRASNRLA